MKKIVIFLMLMISFASFSQTVKKCDCYVVKKSVKKKPVKKAVVKPIAKPISAPCKTEVNVIINNTINVPPKTETIIKRDTIVVIEKPCPTAEKDSGPAFEIYGGVIDPRLPNTRLGYMAGANAIFPVTKTRSYLNHLLIGFELSGYRFNPITTVIPVSEPNTPTTGECNCTTSPIDGFESGGSYVTKEKVTGISLNLGVEIYKGWYLIGGVTSYRHRGLVENETFYTYRNTYIDAGVKKFFKFGRVFLSPTLKFNPEVTSFGLGFSYF